jgi:hypothetical protein
MTHGQRPRRLGKGELKAIKAERPWLFRKYMESRVSWEEAQTER